MMPQVITVSEFIGIINETLGFAYPQVTIEGEVSSFKINQGKFVFFDLKDDQNVLNCFMMVHLLKLPIEDGMKIRVTGSPKISKYSKFSLTVRQIELAGEGELRRAMELLRQKLAAEGLFASERKRPLPRFPRRIGLITSSTSAAYADFIKILSQRWGGLDILLADVNVQGKLAPDQIIEAISYFNQLNDPVDVLVLVRGGGSLEDLQAYSTEPVARAVAASRTPTLVGVGHEIDTSLADYVADVRAATPTDAARILVPDRIELRAEVDHLRFTMDSSLGRHTEHKRQQVQDGLARIERYLRLPRDRVQALRSRLEVHWSQMLNLQSQRVREISDLKNVLLRSQSQGIFDANQRVKEYRRLLQSFDPQANLARGYAIVRQDGKIIRDPANAKIGTAIMIQLAKGNLDAEVKGKS